MSANGPSSSTTNETVKVRGTLDQIGLNFNALCKTTGWHNNCGLNCLTHFLYNKLSKLSSEDFDLFLGQNPEYFILLETFKEYYAIKQEFGWHDILNLLKNHPDATDREAILAPVLRAHLGKMLLDEADSLWNLDASAAISTFRTTGRVTDIAAPIYASNKSFFDTQRIAFETAFIQALEADPTEQEIQTAINQIKFNTENMKIDGFEPKEQEVYEHILFQRKTRLEETFHEEAHVYWMTQGCKRYAEFVANLNNSVMISADQLQTLGERFNIGVEVYTVDSMRAAMFDKDLADETHGAQWLPQREFHWTMKVLNMGFHWTYQEPDSNLQAMQQHNQCYDTVTSKFKINSITAQSSDSIIAELRSLIGEISEAELAEIKSVALLARDLDQKARISPKKTLPFRHDVYAVFNASTEGKEYIKLILANAPLLKVINEQFDEVLAKTFLQNHGGIVSKVKALNLPTQKGLFEAFLSKYQPVKEAVLPIVDALDEALASMPGSVPIVASEQRKGIKLSLLAIMQQNVHAKQLAELIEKSAVLVDAFNLYPDAAIRALVNLPKLPDILPKLKMLNTAELKLFLDKYVASTQVGISVIATPILK